MTNVLNYLKVKKIDVAQVGVSNPVQLTDH